jgi:hypothetical protein
VKVRQTHKYNVRAKCRDCDCLKRVVHIATTALLSVILRYEQQGRAQGGAAAWPAHPQSRDLKNRDFVDIMISEASRDLPFSRNQPLKSADDSTLEF